MVRSKRYKSEKEKIDKKPYPIDEAIKLVQSTGSAKFDASVEVHIRLGVDPKQSDQNVRGTVIFPHGTGKEKRVAVFSSDQKQIKAGKDAGAVLCGGEELVEEIKKTEKTDFAIAVATPEMMRHLAKIGKILGTKGLMPNPKTETITTDIAKTVKELKTGKVAFKMDVQGNLHQIIGKKSFPAEKLKENFEALLTAVKKVRPTSIKGEYLKKISLCSTMGPAIWVGI